MPMQLNKKPQKEGSHKYFIVLWEWIEKGTTRLMCREQMLGDARDGLGGLGAGQGYTLLWCHMVVI